jgi:hypothetical protein
MSRPSIAQRRLVDLVKEHNILTTKLLSIIHDVLSNTKDHTMDIKGEKGGADFIINMEGASRGEEVFSWDKLGASQLLTIYSLIVKQMS